jgi:hypothetical protein
VGGHAVPVVTREHRLDLVVGPDRLYSCRPRYQVHAELWCACMKARQARSSRGLSQFGSIRLHASSIG